MPHVIIGRRASRSISHSLTIPLAQRVLVRERNTLYISRFACSRCKLPWGTSAECGFDSAFHSGAAITSILRVMCERCKRNSDERELGPRA